MNWSFAWFKTAPRPDSSGSISREADPIQPAAAPHRRELYKRKTEAESLRADHINLGSVATPQIRKALAQVHRDRHRLFVHAGIRPGIPPAIQEDHLWIREPFFFPRTNMECWLCMAILLLDPDDQTCRQTG